MSAQCKSCGAFIIWLTTKGGKSMPVDYDTFNTGDPRVFTPDLGHQSHFATCPNADKHRKKR